MPEDKKGLNIQPEHYAAGAGLLPLLVYMSQGKTPDYRDVATLTEKQLTRRAKPGDIFLTRGAEPFSGFRIAGSSITGSPYYHAELVYGKPGRLRTALAGTRGSSIKNLLKGQESALLVRPTEPVTGEAKIKRLNFLAKALGKEKYREIKGPLAGLTQILLPQSHVLGKLPVVCKGNVCSTGPASVYRKMGIDPKLRALSGMELAGDYIRNPNYQIIGMFGSKPSPYRGLTVALPSRLAMAGGIGYGAYKATKDVREGEYAAPVSGLVGAGIGGALGGKLDLAGYNVYGAERAEQAKLKRKLLRMGMSPERAHRTSRFVVKNLSTLFKRAPLTSMLLGLSGGGLTGYLGTKGIYRLLKKKEEVEKDK